jgi:hypothetical protein
MLHTVAEEFDLNREVMKVAGWDLAATAAR